MNKNKNPSSYASSSIKNTASLVNTNIHMLQPIKQYAYQSHHQNKVAKNNNTHQLQYKTTYLSTQLTNKNVKNISKLNNKPDSINKKQKSNHKQQNEQNKFKGIKISSSSNNKKSLSFQGKNSKAPTTKKNSPNKPKANVFTPYNYHDGPTLFPQQQSMKVKLKQNVQQQMLNNYYINKYSALMNKLSNQKIKIQFPQDILIKEKQSISLSKSKDKYSLNKKQRKNFKDVMRRKNGQGVGQHNQSVSKRIIPGMHYYNNHYTNDNQQTINADNDFMRITFSPTTKFQQYERVREESDRKNPRNNTNYPDSQRKSPFKGQSLQRQHSQSSKTKKQIGKLSANKEKFYLNESKSSSVNKKLSLKQRSRNKQTRNSQSNDKIPSSSSRLSNQAYRQNSPSPSGRHNFKQSLIQRRNIHNQYQTNFQAYKKLQSSIINQLYSPSPKKLQLNKWRQIQILGRQMNAQQKKNFQIQRLKQQYGNTYLNKSDDKNNNKVNSNFYSNSIHIFEDNQEDDQSHEYQSSKKYQQQQSSFFYPPSYLNNGSFSKNQLSRNALIDRELLRQKIRNSIQSNNSSLSSSPDKRQQSPLKSSFRKSPSESPRRPLMMQKYAGKSLELIQQSNKQKQWISDFTNRNSFNKRIHSQETQQHSPRSLLSRQNDESPERKSKSLQKTYEKNKTLQKIKQISQKSRSLKNDKKNLEIRQEEEQVESQVQANRYARYGQPQPKELVKVENSSISNQQTSEKDHRRVSFQKHQNYQRSRKQSFHSLNKQSGQLVSVPQSRIITELSHKQFDSNKSVDNNSSQQEDDIQFVPATNQSLFQYDRQKQNNSYQRSPSSFSNNYNNNQNKNTTNAGGQKQTRSRKQSDMSFLSDSNINHNQLSMLSRFSMTSEQGSMIVHKLQQEITQNQFGPYQNALQQLRQLLNENRNAWPIYVVGQRILDDRADYQKKIDLQGKMMKDYQQKIRRLNDIEKGYAYIEVEQEKTIYKNKLQILRLIRVLAEEI